jgi:hypothetical protein
MTIRGMIRDIQRRLRVLEARLAVVEESLDQSDVVDLIGFEREEGDFDEDEYEDLGGARRSPPAV